MNYQLINLVAIEMLERIGLEKPTESEIAKIEKTLIKYFKRPLNVYLNKVSESNRIADYDEMHKVIQSLKYGDKSSVIGQA